MMGLVYLANTSMIWKLCAPYEMKGRPTYSADGKYVDAPEVAIILPPIEARNFFWVDQCIAIGFVEYQEL